MKILITGAEGMLGRTLPSYLVTDELILPKRSELDIRDEQAVLTYFSSKEPQLVIHCAAMTDVDRCESEPQLAWETNALGTRNVALAAQKIQARLINISTDYVFDGASDRPYSEFDIANGGSTVYGKTKIAAEQYVSQICSNYVNLRVSWLYGKGGPSFVHTMLALAEKDLAEIQVVDDQIGSPTSTDAVAHAIVNLIMRPRFTGTVHATCEGQTSWYGFAKKVFELMNVRQAVVPCSSDEYPRPAKRPKNSRLENRVLKMLNLPSMPHWEEALRDFLRKPVI